MDRTDNTRRTILICVLLGAVTLASYWPATRCAFVNYDDPEFLTANPHVQGGLILEGVKWAFCNTEQAAYWAPLMWLSHMVAWQFFGSNAWGHHLINVLLHAASTVLVFLVFRRMTGATWRSAILAALFGLHPLRVESVAWVTERKDVLSVFFFMLTLWAYVRYVEVQGLKSEGRRPKADAESTVPTAVLGSTFGVRGSTFDVLPSCHRFWYWTAVVMFACGLCNGNPRLPSVGLAHGCRCTATLAGAVSRLLWRHRRCWAGGRGVVRGRHRGDGLAKPARRQPALLEHGGRRERTPVDGGLSRREGGGEYVAELGLFERNATVSPERPRATVSALPGMRPDRCRRCRSQPDAGVAPVVDGA